MPANQRSSAPYLITLLLVVFLLFCGWSAYRAATRGSEISDPDYYTKGLKYNTTLVEERAAKVLGWKLQMHLANGVLVADLVDSHDRPVSGGKAHVRLYPPHASAPIDLQLAESAPGEYRSPVPTGLRGEHRARFDFQKDGALLNRQLLLNL